MRFTARLAYMEKTIYLYDLIPEPRSSYQTDLPVSRLIVTNIEVNSEQPI